MFLDGDEVLPGDRLYDLQYGFVSVKQVYADSILVKRRTPAGRQQLVAYNPSGVAANASKKTLYWQNPIVVIPRKDVRIWDMQRKLVLDVTAGVGDLLARPEVLPPHDLSHLTLAEAQSRGLTDSDDDAQIAALRRPRGVQ